MPRIIVTGATGLLGNLLVPALKNRGHQVSSLGRSSGNDIRHDLMDVTSLKSALAWTSHDFILNLAALADVEACQADIHRAYLANTRIPEVLGALSEQTGARVIHISTDHLYDSSKPSVEGDISLKNIYAFSKYAGEGALRGRQAVSLRTNFFGRSRGGKDSFSDWIYKSFSAQNKVSLFTDILFSPLHWSTILEGLESVMKDFQPGVYNFGAASGMSKAEFVEKVARTLGVWHENVQYVSGQSGGRTPRPMGMVMDSGLFSKTFQFSFADLNQEIIKLKKEYE